MNEFLSLTVEKERNHYAECGQMRSDGKAKMFTKLVKLLRMLLNFAGGRGRPPLLPINTRVL